MLKLKQKAMKIDILTLEDLQTFKVELLNDIKALLTQHGTKKDRWMKSPEVRKLLDISSGTLQTLRINGTLPYSKLGGSLYYEFPDVESVLQKNKKGAGINRRTA